MSAFTTMATPNSRTPQMMTVIATNRMSVWAWKNRSMVARIRARLRGESPVVLRAQRPTGESLCHHAKPMARA